MTFKCKRLNNKRAQTAIELAVFGGVVIFLISLIVRAVLGSAYQQDTRLKAFRLAMLTSFEYSEGLKSPPGNWQDGTASRNSASIFIIEDRLTASSAKYSAIDRGPQISTGSATHSRNLFMPVDPGEYANLPMTDFFINGVHFPFTVAGIDTKPLNQGVFKREVNHPATDFCYCGGNVNGGCIDAGGFNRFDLDRDGFVNDGVTDANCDEFFWQWRSGSPGQINVEEGEFTSVDIDGDFHVERILGKNGNTTVDVMDFQQGDIFFGDEEGRPTPGLTNQDVQLFTYTEAPSGFGGDNVGTYLRIDEGRLYDTSGDSRRYVRNAQRKDSLDLVQRTLQLSNDTERFCSGTTIVTPATLPLEANRAGWTAAVPNPVEACCATQACCFSIVNFSRTCMVTTGPGSLDPIIFVRSRILDKHGRKHITPTDADPFVQFLR